MFSILEKSNANTFYCLKKMLILKISFSKIHFNFLRMKNNENYFNKIQLFPNQPKGGESSEISSEETSHSKDQTNSIHFKAKIELKIIEEKTVGLETVQTPSEIIHKTIRNSKNSEEHAVFKPLTEVCDS